MVDLIKFNKMWLVKLEKVDDYELFDSIEEASDYLIDLGVKDDEIDFALIDMTGQEHNRAQFGMNGYFIFSDICTVDLGST